MKLKYFLSAWMSVFCFVLNAQTSSKVIEGSGYSYNYDVKDGFVTFYNSSNLYTYTPWATKDGSSIDEKIIRGAVETIVDDDWTAVKCRQIVNDGINPTQKLFVQGYGLGIRLIINSTTGKVMEVIFDFQDSSTFKAFTFSTFRSIELALKSEVWFTTITYGKEMNYCMVGWQQFF
ncbi:MAG: DUF5043 domain-containing protein [Rikenellaceae bacterium]|nr:DUF5043 domain-containing protein [Rikenellaceae bacterium]